MHRYLPKIYKKSVFDISYKKLKSQGITCLLFDLDNTLALLSENKPSQAIIELIQKLEKDFTVIIVSNSFKKRVEPFAHMLEVDYYAAAMKPLKRSIYHLMKTYHISKENIAFIGDQFMTDMALGNKMGITTIFVDPLSEEDLKLTNINRFFENRIMKTYQRKQLFERGKYYE